MDAALDDEVAGVSGKLFSNLKELNVEHEAVRDKAVRQKLFLVDRYWTGQTSKEELLLTAVSMPQL